MGGNSDNLRKTASSSIALFAAFTLSQGVQAATSEDLEPCINGGVSETGLYVSQAQEDQAKRIEVAQNTREITELDLEPCINGDVSATGMYISQAQEDAMTQDHYVQVDEPSR